MTCTMPRHLRATSISRLAVVGLLVGLAGSLGGLSGCQKSNKKQATELIEDRVKVCRNKDDQQFFTVDIVGGDKKDVLQSTCEKEIGEVEMTDEFSGEAVVGPYTWKTGLDETTGTWVLQAAEWRAFDRARRILDRDDLSAGELERAAKHFGTAIEEFPESEWLRVRRLEVLLDHRAKARDLSADSGAELGELIEQHLTSTVKWANEKGRNDLRARSYLKVVRYFKDLAAEAKKRAENVPAPNEETIEIEKLKGAIEASKKQGNEKQVAGYKEQIENIRKERPKRKKHFEQLAKKANTSRCAYLSKISLSGIQDDDLKSDIDTAKRSTDCEALLGGNGGSGDDESDDSESE